MIDFHAHILPHMDDGSRTVPESVQMLQMAHSQGVNTIVATPHYYRSDETVDAFLARRQESYASLLDASAGLGLLELRLGAEVAFFLGISKCDDLLKLCIEKTNCILLEMPFGFWTAGTMNELYSIIVNARLTPIIAHIERYPDFDCKSSKLNDLLDMGALFQINGEFIISPKTRKRALRLLKEQRACLLGSDCHNLTSRVPNLGAACKIIKKKLGEEHLDSIRFLGEELLYQNPRC